MYLIYMDESGYTQNWHNEKSLEEQPVYVLAGVAINSELISELYKNIRERVNELGIDIKDLGFGGEIKACDVDRGDGVFRRSEFRDPTRKIYLDHENEATYFVIFIDKENHKKTYSKPYEPTILSFHFLLERIQHFLNSNNQSGLIIMDRNDTDDKIKIKLRELLRNGSQVIATKLIYEPKFITKLNEVLKKVSKGIATNPIYETFEWKLKIDRILEIAFGDSKFSLGLQIADFVARHSYSYWKNSKDINYPGWNYIEKRLYNYPNHNGWGYKEFP